MSLDVALDIIGTLRMMKIDEISEEKDENKKELLYTYHRGRSSKWITTV